MKIFSTYIGAFLTAVALVVSCKTPESERTPSILQLDPPTAVLSPFSQSLSFSLQCDLHWTASLEDESWGEIIIQSSREGIGGNLLFKSGMNVAEEARTNVLIIKAGKSELRREIVQEGLGTFFSPKAPEITGLDPVTVSFTAPLPWEARISEGDGWLSLSAASGPKGNASVSFSAASANFEETPRTGKALFTFGTMELPLTISQLPSEKDPILRVTEPGLYGIGGRNFVLAAEGWNQSSLLTEADGALRWRLLHQGRLAAITLTGPRADTQPGQTVTCSVKVTERGVPVLMESLPATLLYEKEGTWWYKVNDRTYFVIKKEVAP